MKTLNEILDTMDIPEKRKELTLANLHWLNRNIAIRNSRHVDIELALHLIKRGIKETLK